MAIVLSASFAARWPFRSIDLIRDEGEYVHLAQEILRGRTPYLDVYNQKTPFVFYFMAAVQAVAGTNLEAVRVATSAYGLLSQLVLYLLARRLFGWVAALWAALAWGVMTFDQCGEYFQASAEFFMLLWIGLALLLWTLSRQRERAWLTLLAGAAAGLAYLTKQNGVCLIAFFAAERLVRWARASRKSPAPIRPVLKDLGLMAAGFAAVLATVLTYFASRGALGAFVECTLTENLAYVGSRPLFNGDAVAYLQGVIKDVIRWDAVIWLFAIVALTSLPWRSKGLVGRDLWLLLLLTFGLAICAGQMFRHYYVPLIVPVALGFGVAASWLCRWATDGRLRPIRRLAAVAALAAPFVLPAEHWATYLDMGQRERQRRRCEWHPLFCTAPDVARYLAKRTLPGEAVLVVGSEPEIYYYAERPAACRVPITYPLVTPSSYSAGLRSAYFQQWERLLPRYVVLVNAAASWSESGGTPMRQFLDSVMRVLSRHHYVREAALPREDSPACRDGWARQGQFLVFRRGADGADRKGVPLALPQHVHPLQGPIDQHD